MDRLSSLRCLFYAFYYLVHHNEGREDITKTFRTFRYACDPFIRIMLEFCIMLDIRLSSCW